MLRVSASIQNPSDDETLHIREGHRLHVDFMQRQGKWRPLLVQRITAVTMNAASGTVDLELADELEWLNRSRDDFTYKKGKGSARTKRPKGWYAHQIARDVARRYGLRVGRLAKGRHLITNLTETNASPLAVIRKAYALDRDETGRRFVIRMTAGRLSITEVRRSRALTVLSGHLIEATLTRRLKEDFATIYDVTAVEKGAKEKKVRVTVRASKKSRRRFGEVRKPLRLDNPVASEAKARQRARRKMARLMRPKRELQVTVPGDPTLRRGDAVRINEPSLGLRELLYVKSASHVLSGSQYTTDLTLAFSDPYRDPEGEKIREKRCRQARKRNRKPPRFCKEGFDYAAPTKGRRRNRRSAHDRKGGVEKASYTGTSVQHAVFKGTSVRR